MPSSHLLSIPNLCSLRRQSINWYSVRKLSLPLSIISHYSAPEIWELLLSVPHKWMQIPSGETRSTACQCHMPSVSTSVVGTLRLGARARGTLIFLWAERQKHKAWEAFLTHSRAQSGTWAPHILSVREPDCLCIIIVLMAPATKHL